MAVQGYMAFNDVTEVPYFALLTNGADAVVVDGNGPVPGSSEALADMADIFGGLENTDYPSLFGLYATAYGCTASPPADVPVGWDAAPAWIQNEIINSQGGHRPARSAVLDRIVSARNALGLDQAFNQDTARYNPNVGVDGTWGADKTREFLTAAGWEPYLYDAEQEAELVASLKARLAAPLAEDDWDEEDYDEVVEPVVVVVEAPAEGGPPTATQLPAIPPPVVAAADETEDEEEVPPEDEPVVDPDAVIEPEVAEVLDKVVEEVDDAVPSDAVVDVVADVIGDEVVLPDEDEEPVEEGTYPVFNQKQQGGTTEGGRTA